MRALALALLTASLAAQAPPTFELKPKVELAFEERLRVEDWDNILDHRDSAPDYRTQWRARTRLWTTLKFGDRLEVCAGILNESRKITRPDMVYHGREVVFETLYADWKFNSAWSLRAGRQNLMRGEGFILFDGNALDGSRSAYFNAADLVWTSGRTKVEFLAISNPLKDAYLPRYQEARDPRELQRLTEWDERAYGVYATLQVAPRTALEAYGFHKTETGDYRPLTHPQFQPDRRVDTLGSRVVQGLGWGLTLSAEGALQRGTQDPKPGSGAPSQDLQAWAGYARLKKAFEAPGKPSFSAAFIGMSGDDPRTSRLEGWDPLFARWPKYSELYIYSLGPEKATAYWSNLGMWELEARLTPWKPLALRATWYRLQALRSMAGQGAAFGTGKRRGDILQFRADLTLGTSWKAHGLYEHLDPGTFYAGSSAGHFLRFEVSYLFKRIW